MHVIIENKYRRFVLSLVFCIVLGNQIETKSTGVLLLAMASLPRDTNATLPHSTRSLNRPLSRKDLIARKSWGVKTNTLNRACFTGLDRVQWVDKRLCVIGSMRVEIILNY